MDKSRIRSVWDMDVFKLAHESTLKIYKITRGFPKIEIYNLVSQMRRAASSVPMNIAECAGRGSKADYRRFVSIANGSVSEISYQIILSRDLGYINAEVAIQLVDDYNRVGQMLTRLMQSLEHK